MSVHTTCTPTLRPLYCVMLTALLTASMTAGAALITTGGDHTVTESTVDDTLIKFTDPATATVKLPDGGTTVNATLRGIDLARSSAPSGTGTITVNGSLTINLTNTTTADLDERGLYAIYNDAQKDSAGAAQTLILNGDLNITETITPISGYPLTFGGVRTRGTTIINGSVRLTDSTFTIPKHRLTSQTSIHLITANDTENNATSTIRLTVGKEDGSSTLTVNNVRATVTNSTGVLYVLSATQAGAHLRAAADISDVSIVNTEGSATIYGLKADAATLLITEEPVSIRNLTSEGSSASVTGLYNWDSSTHINSTLSISGLTATARGAYANPQATGLYLAGTNPDTIFKDTVSVNGVHVKGGSMQQATGIQIYQPRGGITFEGLVNVTDVLTDDEYGESYAIRNKLYNDDSPLSIRSAKMEGDILNDESPHNPVTLSFDGAESYLRGFFRDLNMAGAHSSLTLQNNARWEVVSSNLDNPASPWSGDINTLDTLTLNQGRIFVGTTESEWRDTSVLYPAAQERLHATSTPTELTVTSLGASGSDSGSIYLRAYMEDGSDSSDSLHVTGAVNGSYTLHVKAGGNPSGGTPAQSQDNSYLVKVDNTTTPDNAFTLAEPRTDGSAKEWYLKRVLPAPSPSPSPVPAYSPAGSVVLSLGNLYLPNMLFTGQIADMQRRMQTLREPAYDNCLTLSGIYTEEKADAAGCSKEDCRNAIRRVSEDGAWVSVNADQSHMPGMAGTRLKQKSTRISIGADRKLEGSAWLIGAGAHYYDTRLEADRSAYYARGDADAYGADLYALWTDCCGLYSMFTLSFDRYSADLKTHTLGGVPVTGAKSNTGIVFSAQAGKKIYLSDAQSWYVEPNAELIYSYIFGDDYRLSNGLEVRERNFDSLIGRAGAVIGQTLRVDGVKRGEWFMRFGLSREFLGKSELVINNERFSEDMLPPHVYYGLGFNWSVSDSLRVYAAAERSSGNNYTRDYDIQAGLRWVF